MMKRLLSGFVDAPLAGDISVSPVDGARYTRRGLLVYEGEFASMDGPVTVTKADLIRLVSNHNAKLEHCARLAKTTVDNLPMKDYPPLQLDHSTNATHTVGRVTNRLTLAPYIRKDGKEVTAAYSDVTFLGSENCEKAQDGRWTNLSVGADFEEGTLSELTVTPFSAAPEASLLSRLSEGKPVKTVDYKGISIKVYADQGGFVAVFGNNQDRVGQTADDAIAKAKQVIDQKKLSKGDNMPTPEEKERLKKHLMKKMSDEDAEKHLAKCSESEDDMKKLSAEVDEDEKKLAAEEDEKARLAAEKEDEEKKELKKKKLAAARENISRLSSGFGEQKKKARLAANKASITTRLSKLRAEARITPAEIKKMDLDKLSASSQEVIDAVITTYQEREPVVTTGQLGSTKATELHTLGGKVRMSKLEEETRANMSMLKSTVAAPDKLSATPGNPEYAPVVVDQREAEGAHAEIVTLLDSGKITEAKEKLGSAFKRMSYSSQAEAYMSGDEQQKQITELASTIETMQNQVDELSKLAESLLSE